MTTIPPNPEEALVTVSTPTSDTVRVRDRVESSRFEFYFDGAVEIEEASTDALFFPVDVAANIHNVQDILIPVYSGIIVHDPETGKILGEYASSAEATSFGRGQYEFEIVSTPMKAYIRIDSAVAVHRSPNSIDISLEEESTITLGVRSHHEHPAGTITTTPDVESIMSAVSYFGSALKTTSPERSWPTLRGYPPNLEVGETVSVPDSIEKPDTGVELFLPRTLDAVFKAAPLAYYLAATIKPLQDAADVPYVQSAGRRIPLDGDLTESSTRLLQNNFLLDSIVRTEGFYSIQIEEEELVENRLPWNPRNIYDLPLDERIARYEEVDDGVLSAIRPVWPLTADISPTPDSVDILPHLAEELAKIRVPGDMGIGMESTPQFVDDFVRADGGDVATRTTSSATFEPAVKTPQSWETQMHISLLDGYPLGTNKTSARAYQRHLERESPEEGAIEVHVVCNDDDMREEEVVTELYGVRDLLEFEVNFHYKLTRGELAALLAKPIDLIHFIGHIDEKGILCEDGYLDAETDIEEVRAVAFILNACTSVEQGRALIDKGAYGGIATLFDVPNSSATQLGRSLSRLLNRGFPIRAALNIARESSVLGRRWVSLGDSRLALTQAEGAFPTIINIEPMEDGTFDVEIECFETASHRIGSLVVPSAEWGRYRVMPNRPVGNLDATEIDELFALEVSPVRCDGRLYWTDEVRPEEL